MTWDSGRKGGGGGRERLPLQNTSFRVRGHPVRNFNQTVGTMGLGLRVIGSLACVFGTQLWLKPKECSSVLKRKV